MSENEFTIREFEPDRDLDAVVRCYESGFGPTLWPIFKYSERAAIEDLVMTDHRACNVGLVAEAGGEARGVLFGSFPESRFDLLKHLGLVFALMYRRLISRRHEMRPFARVVLRHVVMHEFLYYMHLPGGKAAEIESFTSQEEWRGGLGRALMDAFVEKARSRGLERVNLGSDSELSWPFYEKYGFKRTAEWKHHGYDYTLPDRDVTAFIYSLHL